MRAQTLRNEGNELIRVHVVAHFQDDERLDALSEIVVVYAYDRDFSDGRVLE